MQIINLTPHAIDIYLEDADNIRIYPDGTVARLETSTEVIGEVDGIPITQTSFGPITGLPEIKTTDTIYIVSSLIAQACQNRSDVYFPNEIIRDDQGRIIGCKSLGRIAG